jgi:hypothetical protein
MNVPPPLADHLEQQHFLGSKGFPGWHDNGPRRSFPREQPFVEFDPTIRRWRQGNRLLSNFRPKHYWTRPNDGKHSGGWGRFKDALTGEGPDVFVTTSGDKRTLMRDRPRKWQWSGWPIDNTRQWDAYFDPDHRRQDFMQPREAPWTKKSSRQGAQYNFRTRTYETPFSMWQNSGAGPSNEVWRDAQWKPNAKRSDTNPYSYQTPNQQWWSRVPASAGFYPGGRPRI